MKNYAMIAAVAAALTLSAGAQAASIITDSGGVRLEASDSPFEFTIDYSVANNPDLAAVGFFTFTGTASNNQIYNFDFRIRNRSDVASRLSVFGFDTNRQVTGGTSQGGGEFDVIALTPTTDVPNIGTVDICFKDAGPSGNCNNGQSGGAGGLGRDSGASGSFGIVLSGSQNSLLLPDFFVRFQGVGTTDQNFTGVGAPRITSAVPEPTTWAMMLVGFGAVGYSMRRRPAVKTQLA
jgi:hypothetical protein